MPGLAANPSIFEYIDLPVIQFEMHWLEWIIPLPNETLPHYAERMTSYIEHENVVLIGVSFGGIIIQEMAKLMEVKRLIIISSVKCRDELPRRFKYAGKTGFFKVLPTSLMNYVDHFEKIAFGKYLSKRAKLYKKYLSVRDTKYLDWAIEKMVLWNCEEANPDVIHIHGDKDEIFPHKYINGYITVKGGTHIMIINKFRWFNKHLPELILKGRFNKK
jgi:pimeloyl-ACP methyl ester carboxylesterase